MTSQKRTDGLDWDSPVTPTQASPYSKEPARLDEIPDCLLAQLEGFSCLADGQSLMVHLWGPSLPIVSVPSYIYTWREGCGKGVEEASTS
jgi:hypothetical protein